MIIFKKLALTAVLFSSTIHASDYCSVADTSTWKPAWGGVKVSQKLNENIIMSNDMVVQGYNARGVGQSLRDLTKGGFLKYKKDIQFTNMAGFPVVKRLYVPATKKEFESCDNKLWTEKLYIQYNGYTPTIPSWSKNKRIMWILGVGYQCYWQNQKDPTLSDEEISFWGDMIRNYIAYAAGKGAWNAHLKGVEDGKDKTVCATITKNVMDNREAFIALLN